MAFALVGVISSAQATPESEDAEAVGNALQSFATRLASGSDALGDYGDLAETLPLTDLAPGDPDALDLSNLLGTYFTPANLGSFASMSDLAASIDALDDDSGPLKIQFGQDASSPIAPAAAAVTATATSITIPIAARRSVSEPLEFEFGPTSMSGGSLGVDLALDTTLTLTVDPSQITDADAAPATAVSLAPPTINLCSNATGSVGVFTARFGFTDLKVSTDNPATGGAPETATLHACANVVFTDPDSTGGITGDEWASHALTELATAEIVDAPGTDLAATFYADASLIDGDAFTDVEAADASIAFNDDNLANGFSTPTPTLGALDDWDNISAGDVANGLAQFVASLAGSQSKANGPLPFLKKGLSETFEAVKPLTDYTARLTSAEVGCGTEPGDADSFPSGLTDNLAAGTLVYCRAKTQLDLDDGTVAWTLPAGVSATAVSGQTSDATLGNASTTPPGPSPDRRRRLRDDRGGQLRRRADLGLGHRRRHDDDDGDPAAGDCAGAVPEARRRGRPRHLRRQARLLVRDQVADVPAPEGQLRPGRREHERELRRPAPEHDEPLRPPGRARRHGLDELQRRRLRRRLRRHLRRPPAPEHDRHHAAARHGDGRRGQHAHRLRRQLHGRRQRPAPRPGRQEHDRRHASARSRRSRRPRSPARSGGTWSAGDAYDVDGGLVDRFYVKVDSAQPELSVDDARRQRHSRADRQARLPRGRGGRQRRREHVRARHRRSVSARRTPRSR